MKLRAVTKKLEGLEETIIVHLCERAQFRYNSHIYAPFGKGDSEEIAAGSLFDLRLRDWEKVESLFGRFFRPEERPFQSVLPKPRYLLTEAPPGLSRAQPATPHPAHATPQPATPIHDYNEVNLTATIREAYMKLVRRICPEGDDGSYDLSMERDICALKAISRRIHFGAFYVGECKYQQEPQIFRELAAKKDTKILLQKITREDIEEKVLSRVRAKTLRIQRGADPKVRSIIDPNEIVQFYRETIIPLTKEGEIRYISYRALGDAPHPGHASAGHAVTGG